MNFNDKIFIVSEFLQTHSTNWNSEPRSRFMENDLLMNHVIKTVEAVSKCIQEKDLFSSDELLPYFRPCDDHVTILLGILAFQFSNSRVNNFYMDKRKIL